MSYSLLRLDWSARRKLLREIDKAEWRVNVLERACLTWHSAWFSVNDRLQERAYSEQLSKVGNDAAPLFILGFWRSGTTFLHELICCDQRFGYPTTAQCMNPSTMLLMHAPGRKSSDRVRRPMDGMIITSESPQEDEFALLALGLPSAYQLLLKPRDVESALRALDPDAWSAEETERWTEGFQRFVRRLRLLEARRLVFKSPTHSFRAPLLHRLYPHARFVVIQRDPVDVWHSNMKLWRLLCERYALTRWTDHDTERFVAEAYRLFTRKLDEARRELGDHAPVECAFERLAANPVIELENLYRQLGIEVTAQARAAWNEYLASRADHRPASYDVSEEERREILTALGTI